MAGATGKSLQDMIDRIASEIVRGDINAQIENAILDAINTYQGERFWFTEPSIPNEPTFNTVIGQATYDEVANAQLGLMYDIDYMTYVQGNTVFQIIRRSPLEVQTANQIGQIAGPPCEFSYAGSSVTIYPTPDQVYTISIFGHINVDAPPDAANTTNVWMNTAEKLIRCRAKYELAMHVTRNAQMAQAMHPDQSGGPGGLPGATYMAFQELKTQTNKLTSLGRIQAMPF